MPRKTEAETTSIQPTMRPGRDINAVHSNVQHTGEQPRREAQVSKPRHKRKACTPRKKNALTARKGVTHIDNRRDNKQPRDSEQPRLDTPSNALG
ncbi:hypothetical protein V6N13_025806 [Hibiscus sabdariffa]